MRRSITATVLLVPMLLLGGCFLRSCLRNPVVPKVRAGVTLIGMGTSRGDESDLSGLEGLAADGKTPNNRLGGHGSAVAYTGKGDNYLFVCDSGPKNAGFPCRVHQMTVHVTPGGGEPVKLKLTATKLLTTMKGEPLSGALDPLKHPKREKHLELDPEGLRVGRGGEIFISDEYGPVVYQFDTHGKLVNGFTVPKHFRCGRQENRGMEGLAISPDGTKLYGAMQSPLIQDGGREVEKGKREGVNCRILEINIADGQAREFVYKLDSPANSVCEILAVSDATFLVLERDGKESAFKKVFRIDLADATPVRDADKLPATVAPVKKTLFIDLLAEEYGIAGANCPEKFEGLAFGPDLPDGRHLLLVTVDNDFDHKQPFRVYAFAIDKAALPDFRPQRFDPK